MTTRLYRTFTSVEGSARHLAEGVVLDVLYQPAGASDNRMALT